VTKDISFRQKKVTIKSISNNRVVIADADVYVPSENRYIANFFLISIALILLAIGVFFPPILLLNIPILIIRYAYTMYHYIKEHIVRLSFICPSCGKSVPLQEISDRLPFMIACPLCKIQLEIEENPVYLKK